MSRTLKHLEVEAGGLNHGTFGRQGSAQDGDAAVVVQRVVEGANHFAVDRHDVHVGQVLGQRLAGHREGVAVQQACVQQGLHHHGYATHAVDVVHHVLAKRLEVGDVRHLVVDAVEVIERELDIGLMRDGEQVEDGVGRTTKSHEHSDGIFERLLRENVARGNSEANQVDHGLARTVRKVVTTTICAGRRGRAGQAHAQSFGNRRHGVGGVHAATGTLSGANSALNEVEIRLAHLAGLAGAHGFERVDNGHALLGAVRQANPAGRNRTGIQEDGCQVETRGSHEHARQGLVAAGEQNGAIEALGLHHHLNGVGNHLARHE